MTLDLRRHLHTGDGVWWGQGAAAADPWVDALLDQAAEVGGLRGFCGISLHRGLREPPLGLSLTSYGAMGELRSAAAAGALDVVPAHYSALPRLFAERALPGDVGLVQVAPPGPDGLCSWGIGVDYVVDAARYSRTLLAEINHRMPRTTGATGIDPQRFADVVETDRALPESRHREPDAVDRAIATNVAELVRDGDTLQVGVGTLPSAILAGLSGHRDLGVHSGMITDGVLDLVRAGVVTGARKEADAGLVVTGTAMGTSALYEALPGLPVSFRPVGETHGAAVLARFARLVAINSALAVDLSGQVGAEVAGGRYLGGVGGQADFSGAAARTGACSIIALRSTAGGSAASAVVPSLPDGVVTTARADVDAVVTEYGVAWLRGRRLADRPRVLAAVAAPEHRESLLASVRRRH